LRDSWGVIGRTVSDFRRKHVAGMGPKTFTFTFFYVYCCRPFFTSGCSNQEIGQLFLFKGVIIGTCSYFSADCATWNSKIVCRSVHWEWLECQWLFSGCPNQEIGWPVLFKGLIIETCSYFGADSATEKDTVVCSGIFSGLDRKIGGLYCVLVMKIAV
jgi:hypothetical protein